MAAWYLIKRWIGRLVPTEPPGLPWGLTVEAILSTMPGWLAVVDMEQRILLANRSFAEHLGYHASEVVARSISEIVRPQGSPFVGEPWQQLLREGVLGDVEMAYRAKDGTEIPVSFHARLVHDHARRPISVVTVAMDMRRVQGLIKMLRDVSSAEQSKAAALEQSQQEMRQRMVEMGRFQKLMVDRELRMAELKREIQQLREQAGAR